MLPLPRARSASAAESPSARPASAGREAASLRGGALVRSARRAAGSLRCPAPPPRRVLHRTTRRRGRSAAVVCDVRAQRSPSCPSYSDLRTQRAASSAPAAIAVEWTPARSCGPACCCYALARERAPSAARDARRWSRAAAGRSRAAQRRRKRRRRKGGEGTGAHSPCRSLAAPAPRLPRAAPLVRRQRELQRRRPSSRQRLCQRLRLRLRAPSAWAAACCPAQRQMQRRMRMRRLARRSPPAPLRGASGPSAACWAAGPLLCRRRRR